MCKIIDFSQEKHDRFNHTSEVDGQEHNLLDEIAQLQNEADSYDGPIPQCSWDGECWEDFFKHVCIPLSSKADVSPWDILALNIKINFDWKGIEKN